MDKGLAHSEKQLLYFRGASSQREPASGIPYRQVLGLRFLNIYMTVFGTDKCEHTDEPCFNVLSLQNRIRAVFGKNWLSLRSGVICARWDGVTQNCKVMHKGNFVLRSRKFVHWKSPSLERPERWTRLWVTMENKHEAAMKNAKQPQ